MNKEEDFNIRNNSSKTTQSSPKPSNTDFLTQSEDAESATWSKHLTWIQRKKISLRHYVRAFKSYMLSSEDDRNFHCSTTDQSTKEKSYIIPELPKELHQNGAIIKTSTGLVPSTENMTPSTSKRFAETSITTQDKEIDVDTIPQNINLQTDKNILSDSDDDDSIVIAYLKDKDFTVDAENSSSPLSESSLDVHIPSYPGSPRSLNFGSGPSIESHDTYFAEAIEFLHEDKDFLIAAETGNDKILRILLSKQEDIQQMDHLGRNALHLAVCSGNEAAVKLLLNTNIKRNVKDNLGMTPLYLSLMRRPSYKMANLLFDHGAEIAPRCNPVDTGLFLQFVMMCIPTKEDARILELLVRKGAIVNDPEAPGGRQALHFAAMSNNCCLIRILVQLGADLTVANHRKETPKDVARIFKCKEAYELLSELENENDLSSESSSSETII